MSLAETGPVYLERLLQVNLATLAALATLLLCMGGESPVLPLVVMIAAGSSVWLTDITGWFRLNRTIGNLAGLVAVCMLFWNLLRLTGEAQLMSIAVSLVYLQIILLFQEKGVRAYWQLLLLSLFQVVVAAAINQGLGFGVLLVVYLFAGLSALTLLFLFIQWSRFRQAELPLPLPAGGGRWPLAGCEPAISGLGTGAGGTGTGSELFLRIGAMTVGSLLLAVPIFFAVPRLGGTPWRVAAPTQIHVAGFSDAITLGELGETIEKPEEIVRVRLIDGATGQPYSVLGELYLRGTILTVYRKGEWRYPPTGSSRGTEVLEPVASLPQEQFVRQQITIEPLHGDELFCVWPFFLIHSDQSLLMDYDRQRLLRPSHLASRRFRFELGTTAFADGYQSAISPCEEQVRLSALLRLPETTGSYGLPRLAALAAEWIAASGLPPENRIGRAKVLEQQLRGSGQFQYSLQGQKRDLSIDPIEDFIANNPRGHCEYFATALAMMLRSQGIPARLAVGFKTDQWNEMGKYFRVRQLHAHAWVEAYLQPEDIPPELLGGSQAQRWAGGAWLRLDATPPGSRTDTGFYASGILSQLRSAIDWLQSAWESYVVELDRASQRQAIYEPLIGAAGVVLDYLRDPYFWRSLLGAMANNLNPFRWQWTGGRWPRVALAALVAFGALAAGWWCMRRFWRRLWGWLVGRSSAAAVGNRSRVEFYYRFETLLARWELLRSAGQTQHEFALAAGAAIAQATGQPQLASLATRVVDAFYRVRFGRLPLDNQQTEAVEHALAELQRAAGQAQV